MYLFTIYVDNEYRHQPLVNYAIQCIDIPTKVKKGKKLVIACNYHKKD